jgi:hypothetical protein
MQMVKVDREFVKRLAGNSDAALLVLDAVDRKLATMPPEDPRRPVHEATRDFLETLVRMRTELDRAHARIEGGKDLQAH